MEIQQGRRSTQVDDGVVVFLIGMRINRLRRVRSWLPVAKAMGPMMRALLSDPDSGLLHATNAQSGRTSVTIQYWRSVDDLHRFARDPDQPHAPAWQAFLHRARKAEGDVGIYHETYVIGPGRSETIYADMPAWGLGKAIGTLPAGRVGDSAADRLARRPKRDRQAATAS